MADTVIRPEAVGNFPGPAWLWSTRLLTALCGIFSILWAASSLQVYRTEAPFKTYADDILRGEKFNPEQLKQIRLQLDATPLASVRPSAVYDIAVVRLRLAEAGGKTQPPAADLDSLQSSVTTALAGSPTSSFLWLIESRLQDRPGGNPDRVLQSLRMSYLLGPNEGWIALRRNPFALRLFPTLPPALAESPLSEFAGLVRSGLYSNAANILAGPGWPIREQLLARLTSIGEGYRRSFAKVLEGNGMDGGMVPK